MPLTPPRSFCRCRAEFDGRLGRLLGTEPRRGVSRRRIQSVIDGALARFYGADMSRRPARAAVIAIALVATVLGGCSSSSSGSGASPSPTAAPASRSAKPHAVGVLTETFVDTGHQ